MTTVTGEPSTSQSVEMRVPPTAGHLSLLRTVVGGCAGREDFTLDQVDDLRMAVDEAAVQLLRHVAGDAIELTVTSDEDALEIRVGAETKASQPVIDRESFSWTILQALADELDVDALEGRTTVVMRKKRLPDLQAEDPT